MIIIILQIALIIAFIHGLFTFKNKDKSEIKDYKFKKVAWMILPILFIINLIFMMDMGII